MNFYYILFYFFIFFIIFLFNLWMINGTVHYLPKFEKPEIHLKHLKTSYTSQKLGLTFFKDYGLVKPRLHQTGQ